MHDILKTLGLDASASGASDGTFFSPGGPELDSLSPVDGKSLGTYRAANVADYRRIVEVNEKAFAKWRMVPAPKRGEIVRLMGEKLREHKAALGKLVSLEMGKILAEGEGEVQEMIDMADFAVGLSRQLYGVNMQSERPLHRMTEQWHPLGTVGVISAFNFPVAVWSWNAFVAAACGNTVIWKPSLKTPWCGIAVQHLMQQVLDEQGYPGVFTLVIGQDAEVGEALINDPKIPLVSATGSTRMGLHVGQTVAKRMGKSLLELGGNNAVLVMDDADMDLATRAIVFGAVGTAGQRCTSTRRVLMHKDIASELTDRLLKAYTQVTIGDPTDPGTLMGPLIDEDAVSGMEAAIAQVKEQGGEILCGGGRYDGGPEGGHYVVPCVVKAKAGMPIVKEETFAPVLYLIEVDGLEDAIATQNDVPQGLSSAIFTESVKQAERFLSAAGSDCGIANVNIGTSGAEIGGAFGGEKATGGGREAGSDAWKAYMRRQTQTINWSDELPLAQGISFG